MSSFDITQIPAQQGRIAIVTGANTGIGFETAKALAAKQMQVILACRNLEKAEAAKARILSEQPQANLAIIVLDLSQLDSVRNFAQQFNAEYQQLDLLINNAGIMMPPYSKTADGFELQMGVNHFGHFLLTGLLIDKLLATPKSRVVNVSSIAHKRGSINFDDPHWEKRKYSKFQSYAQSKIANLLFTYKLNQRLKQKTNHSCIAVAAHPGVSNTDLSRHMPWFFVKIFTPIFSFMIHPPHKAALPSLMAALAAEVQAGQYFGPQGAREMKGEPGLAEATSASQDPTVAQKLWALSEKLTGIKFL